MKKLVCLVLSAAFLTTLCGCTVKVEQPESTNNITTGNNTSTTVEQTEDTTVPLADPVASGNDLSRDKVIWGPGNITDHQQPADPISLQETFGKYGASWLLNDEKSICLTFDEGYENGYTSAILDTLKEKKVQAMFFVTYDFAKDNPKLIKRMIDEGHIVGNHTYRHYSMDEQTEDVQREEIQYLHKYIEDNYNYTMSYFRFPKGEFSQQSLWVANDLGYKSIFWSYAYADWDPNAQPDKASTLNSILDSTHPGEIMLLHAVSQTNAEILGDVIDGVRKQGYTFTVDI